MQRFEDLAGKRVGVLAGTTTEQVVHKSFEELGLRATIVPVNDHRAGIDLLSDDKLDAYFAGKLRAFNVPVAPRGTEFQRKCWAALQQIPYGATRSYGQQADAINNPKAVRAVGLANGRNPISIIIPCHRVIGANGGLTGYGGGMGRKQFLLDLEQGAGVLGLKAS